MRKIIIALLLLAVGCATPQKQYQAETEYHKKLMAYHDALVVLDWYMADTIGTGWSQRPRSIQDYRKWILRKSDSTITAEEDK